MMLVAGFVLGVWPAGSALFFLAVSAFYVLVSLSLGPDLLGDLRALPPRRCRRPCCSASRWSSCAASPFPIRNMPMRAAVARRAVPGDALHPREPRHLPARRGAARRCCPSWRCSRLFGVGLMVLARRALESRREAARLSNVLAVAYSEGVVLRHDKAFLATVMVQPVIMLLLYSASALEQAGERAVGGARPQRQRSRRAAWSPTSARPATSCAPVAGRQLRRGPRLLQRGAVAGAARHPARLRPRPGARPTAGPAPARRHRPAQRGARRRRTSARSRRASTPGGRRRRGKPLRRARRWPIDVRQRFWFNATLADRDFFLAILAGMLLTNLCLCGVELGIVGERESGTYEQMLSLPTSPLADRPRQAAAPRGRQLRPARVHHPRVRAALRPLAAGQLARARARHAAVRARLARDRRLRLDAGAHLGAGRLHLGLLHPAVVRALRRDVSRTSSCRTACAMVGGVLPLRWYQIALRRLMVARRRDRRRDGSRARAAGDLRRS